MMADSNRDNSDNGCGYLIAAIFLFFLGPPGWVVLFILWLFSIFLNPNDNQPPGSISSTSSETLSPDVPDDINNILIDLSNGEIKDLVTQETFRPGDQVHLCLVHRLAYHQDSWEEMGGQCTICGHGNNTKLYTLPTPVNFKTKYPKKPATANLQNYRSNNSPRNSHPSYDHVDSIVWEEDEGIYKPIRKDIGDFSTERGISQGKNNLVYIRAEALTDLKNHLHIKHYMDSNWTVGKEGILFGNAYEDEDHIYVEITTAVSSPVMIGTDIDAEFTPNLWLEIIDNIKAKYPAENIVGWYHSHPNLGVFMSGTDMRTQRAFFNHVWSLSIVHDPVRKTTGYFLGKDAQEVQPIILK